MESTLVSSRNKLENDVERDSGRYQFFKLISTLESLGYLSYRKKSSGYDALPKDEAVKFVTSNNLSFPVGEVSRVNKLKNQYIVEVNFFGLTGPSGILPNPYLEEIQQLDKERNTGLREFFNIFNNRSIAFFYRAFKKNRLGYSIQNSLVNENSLDTLLASLLGPSAEPRDDGYHINDELYKNIGHYSSQNRNSSSLTGILHGFLGMPVAIRQRIPEWLDLDRDDRSILGSQYGENRNNILGVDLVLGEQAFSVESKFEVVIGPIERYNADMIAPGTVRFNRLVELISRYVGFSFQYDLRYLLTSDSRIGWKMGDQVTGPHGLGWSTWLGGTELASGNDEILIPYSSFRSVAA